MKDNMPEKVTAEKSKAAGWGYFFLGLNAFAGLGIEVLYAFLIELLLYGAPMHEWTDIQKIIHWVVTCITWGAVSYLLIRNAQKKLGFVPLPGSRKMKPWQWAAAVLGVCLVTAWNYVDWNGFKVLMEYQRQGLVLFIFQYLYYAFETVLFMLIIVFGQKAFEIWFGRGRIPYGGILCGLTWGLAHIFTKGSLMIGFEGAVFGFLLGAMYLLVNRDIRKTYVLLFIMFAM